jgi:antitoxin (DNA-binding transcriptional repressor) of toxin-antitoxin stability system
MIIAKIAQIKNQFSQYIQKVKMGEVVIVYDRNEPVAQIEMIKHSSSSNLSVLQDLAKKGILKIGKNNLKKDFFEERLPELKNGISLSKELIKERRESSR